MRKKLLSIFVILALVINLMPITYVKAASESKITISADKTDVKPGDTINYTVSAQSDVTFISMELILDFPNGLTYVSGSGKFNEDLANLILKDRYDDADYNEIKNQIGIVSANGYNLNGSATLATFQCTVDNDASGDLEVGFSKHKWASAPKGALIDHSVQTATVHLDTSVTATGISLNKTTTTLEKGKSETLTATVQPSDATDKTITWVSSDTSVATVDNNGKVTANKKGTATITAKTVNNHTANCVVTVTQPITGIKLNKTKMELSKGDTERLTATVEPSNADGDKTVTWTSSDPSKVSVSSDGVVTALEKGSATITAKTSNGKEATCTVTVGVPLQSISLNETAKTIKNGDSYTFTVTCNPEDTDVDKKVSWSSSNPQVATVDNNGKVTVVACSGTATITVTSDADNTKTATALVTASHKDDKLTLQPAKAATCTEKGNKEYYTCSGCQDWFADKTGAVKIDDKTSIEIPVDANAHDWDEGTVTTEPTCTEPGVLTKTCKNNNGHHGLIGIPALGHDLTKHDAKEATCLEDGNKEYYTCSVCNKYFEDATGNKETTLEDTVVKATGHDWGEWVETTPATKEAEGEETRTCKNDSSHVETRAIPKLHDHVLTKTDAKEATCSEEGNIEYYTCSVCNKKFSDSEGTKEVDDVVISIDSNAHDWSEWKTTKEATCTEKGSKTRTCNNDSKHTETEEIEMLAHKLTKVDAVEATCESEGNKEYYKCSVCDKYFEDATANTEITDKTSVVTSALGHDWDEGTITTPKTCTTDGVKTYTCKHDSKHTRTEAIPAGHELVKVEAKDATCIAEGNKEYWECSECNKKFSDENASTEVTDVVIPVDSNAHDWEDWTVTKEATVDEEGSRTRTCKNDSSHVETETIARIPYAIEKGNGQTHTYEQGTDIEIKANGTLDKLTRLLVDGVELSEENYTLESGSTIATLKTAYLDTLSVGEHTLTFEYTDGSVDAKFNIAKVATPDSDTTDENTETETTSTEEATESTTNKTATKSSSPRTGDNIMVWISLLIASVLGVIATAKFMKKKEK